MSEMEYKLYIQNEVDPIMAPMITAILSSRPANPIKWMIEYLTKKAGPLSSSGADSVAALKSENAKLKKRIKALEAKLKDSDASEESESDEDEDEPIAELPVIAPPPPRMPMQKKKPRASISAEAFGIFNPRREFTPPTFVKTAEQMSRLKSIVTRCFMFACLEPRDLETVLLAMCERKVSAGERIIKQGEEGSELYVIEDGEFECFKKFNDGNPEKMVKALERGDIFGELALLYMVPRAASVEAKTDSLIWSLDRQTFNHIVKDAASRRRDNFERVLKKVPLLQGMNDYDRSKLIDALKPETFAAGDYIITEGDEGDAFYILEDGKAFALKRIDPKDADSATKVKEYSAGDYFGELALLRNDTRAASIVCETECRVLSVDRRSFKRLLGPLEVFLAKQAVSYDEINRALNIKK